MNKTEPMYGCLFTNKYKKQDNHPDYAGRMEIDDELYFLSGWVKRGQSDGKPYISLNMKLADEKYQDKEGKSKKIEENKQDKKAMIDELNAPLNPTGYKPNVSDPQPAFDYSSTQPAPQVKDDEIPF